MSSTAPEPACQVRRSPGGLRRRYRRGTAPIPGGANSLNRPNVATTAEPAGFVLKSASGSVLADEALCRSESASWYFLLGLSPVTAASQRSMTPWLIALLAALVLLFRFQGGVNSGAAAHHRPACGSDSDPSLFQLRSRVTAEPRVRRSALRDRAFCGGGAHSALGSA